jgi:mono/diheme cytochrome c family protein
MVRFTTAVTILLGVALFTGFALSTGVARAADVAEGRVTFQRDVLPILAKHCQGCHRPGQVAPMSFLTYETTRPWAPQIKALVAAKKMPPVVGTPHYIILTQGEGLTHAEIATLVTWVDDGAPEGTARDAKSTPPGQGRKK